MSDCENCEHLRTRLEQARQAYRELEDALAIADERLIPQSITSYDRALSVAIYERMERCKGQMGESSSSAATPDRGECVFEDSAA